MAMIKAFWKIGFLSILLLAVVVVSCGDDEEPAPAPMPQPEDPQPTASFTFNVDERTVTFDNTSSNARTYSWEFGDGNSSTAESPSHTYATDGSFEVTLTATNGSNSNSETQSVAVMIDPDPDLNGFVSLLSNQVNEVIIPTYEAYQVEMGDFLSAVESFVGNVDEAGLESVRSAYPDAYLAYQAGAVHDYYATSNLDLVNTTNLYPIDISQLDDFIENESYNFNATAQQRANGFPALDYLLYGSDDVLSTFSDQPKRGAFLLALVTALKDKADALVDRWTGNLRENFIGNGGTGLGSSISVQLNMSLVYYEDHIRGNKVGLPIGRLGPNDTPIDPDPMKIEAYYESLQDGDDNMALSLLRAAIEEMEDIYLGSTATGEDGQGYDDLLISRDQASIDADIKAQYQDIYDQINSRTSISGDEALYNSVQGLVTLYKSDLFPVLNVQDADGANDGD